MRTDALLVLVCATAGAALALDGPAPVSAQGTAPATAPTQYVNSLEVVIDAPPAEATAVDAVDVWLSSDAGRTWSTPVSEPAGRHGVRVRVAEAGRFEVYVVLRNATGASAPPPATGSPPSLTVIVDTLPPLVQLHGPIAEVGSDRLEVRCTLIEENLAADGVHMFTRTGPGDAWVDAGPAKFREGRLTWPRASGVAGEVDIRAVATDRAGNRGISELLAARIPPSSTSAVHPPAHAFGPPAALFETRPAAPSDALDAQIAELRRVAQVLVQQQQYGPAIGRYEEALSLAPGNADLLAELGGVLHRAGRYEDAAERFQSILRDQPAHAGALEGAALAAATLRRYADARRYLLALQKLRPQNASVWLRSGDVEHRLGHGDEALALWERALRAATSDPATRNQARQRLQYFGRDDSASDARGALDPREPDPRLAPDARGAPDVRREAWPREPNNPNPRPSSSSTATTTTRKPSP